MYQFKLNAELKDLEIGYKFAETESHYSKSSLSHNDKLCMCVLTTFKIELYFKKYSILTMIFKK